MEFTGIYEIMYVHRILTLSGPLGAILTLSTDAAAHPRRADRPCRGRGVRRGHRGPRLRGRARAQGVAGAADGLRGRARRHQDAAGGEGHSQDRRRGQRRHAEAVGGPAQDGDIRRNHRRHQRYERSRK